MMPRIEEWEAGEGRLARPRRSVFFSEELLGLWVSFLVSLLLSQHNNHRTLPTGDTEGGSVEESEDCVPTSLEV